jgi:hypothetical protein
MKKIIYLIISIILLIYVNGCTGYKPIYSSSNFQFEITDHSIKGNKKLGNKIYSKLYRLFKSNKDNLAARSVHITIEAIDSKSATVKNSAGKILEYKVVLTTNVILKDFLTNDEILNHNVILSSAYKIQDEHSDTKQLESRTIENLVNKTHQDLLIKISEIALNE